MPPPETSPSAIIPATVAGHLPHFLGSTMVETLSRSTPLLLRAATSGAPCRQPPLSHVDPPWAAITRVAASSLHNRPKPPLALHQATMKQHQPPTLFPSLPPSNRALPSLTKLPRHWPSSSLLIRHLLAMLPSPSPPSPATTISFLSMVDHRLRCLLPHGSEPPSPTSPPSMLAANRHGCHLVLTIPRSSRPPSSSSVGCPSSATTGSPLLPSNRPPLALPLSCISFFLYSTSPSPPHQSLTIPMLKIAFFFLLSSSPTVAPSQSCHHGLPLSSLLSLFTHATFILPNLVDLPPCSPPPP